MAFGGGILLIPNMKIGNLFISKRATVISLMEGCIDASAVVFVFVKIAYQSGISIKSVFLFIAFCTVIQWGRTLFCMPRTHIPYPLPDEGYSLGVLSIKCKEDHSKKLTLITSMSSVTPKGNLKMRNDTQPLSASLKDYRFWLNVMHLSILRLRVEMFICNLADWLQSSFPQHSESDISMYINIFGYLSLSVVILAPINGVCTDSLLEWFKRTTPDGKTATCKATAVMLAITSAFGILFSLSVCIPSLPFQLLSFILLFIVISCLYGGHSTFIALIFPEEHFGRLHGISKFISAIAAFLQYPLIIYVHRICGDNFLPLSIIFILACLITVLHPIILIKTTGTDLSRTEKQTQLLQKSCAFTSDVYL